MDVPRRSFIKTGTFAAVSAGLAVSSVSSAVAQKRRDPQEGNEASLKTQQDARFSFTRETFAPYVGDIFQAPNALGRMVSLTLIDVSAYKIKDDTKISTKTAREPRSFSLTFSATERLPRFTSIHKVSHPALGEFDLFLTSRKSKDGTLLYDAIFNHL